MSSVMRSVKVLVGGTGFASDFRASRLERGPGSAPPGVRAALGEPAGSFVELGLELADPRGRATPATARGRRACAAIPAATSSCADDRAVGVDRVAAGVVAVLVGVDQHREVVAAELAGDDLAQLARRPSGCRGCRRPRCPSRSRWRPSRSTRCGRRSRPGPRSGSSFWTCSGSPATSSAAAPAATRSAAHAMTSHDVLFIAGALPGRGSAPTRASVKNCKLLSETELNTWVIRYGRGQVAAPNPDRTRPAMSPLRARAAPGEPLSSRK